MWKPRFSSFLERFSLVLLSTGVIPGGGVTVLGDLKIILASATAVLSAAETGKVFLAIGFEEYFYFPLDGFSIPLIHYPRNFLLILRPLQPIWWAFFDRCNLAVNHARSEILVSDLIPTLLDFLSRTWGMVMVMNIMKNTP